MLAFVLLSTGGTLRARRQATTELQVRHIKLENFGWQQPPRPRPGEVDSFPSQRVTIDSEGRVLVSFTVREPGEGLHTRAEPGLLLRIVRFGADGNADLSLTLPTNNWLGNGIYLDQGDRLIARANDKLQMFADNHGTRANGTEWRTLTPCGPHCEVLQSLSRRTLYVRRWGTGPPVTILDMEDPERPRTCEAPGYTPQSITDDFSYFNYDPGNPPMPPPVLYRWPLCDYAQRTELPIPLVRNAPGVWSIADDSLLLAGRSGGFAVYGPEGEVKRKLPPIKRGKHEAAGVQGIEGISQDGQLLVFTASTWKGGFAALDIGSHMTAERIIVYDVATGEPLATVPIRPLDFSLHPAISPDGHRVAALAKDTLTIVDVP